MLKRCLIGGVLPLGLLVSACSSEQTTVPVDTSGTQSQSYTAGWNALNSGDNTTAAQYLAQSYATRPDDPFEEINYAAALQNTGQIDQAVPLYRDAIAKGGNLYGAESTRPEVQGMSVAQVAKWNLAQAGRDEAGNVIAPAQGAALVAPNGNTFEVFFAFNSAAVSREGASTVRQAAQKALSGNLVRITVTGHTDTVGSNAYNQRLSLRRARAVERALIADGIPRDDIVARGVGKQGLLVPTADQVREPQNRRVEIVEEEAQVN
jgi:outer membrane protein OmpA-like peptidoglycan-associated protein